LVPNNPTEKNTLGWARTLSEGKKPANLVLWASASKFWGLVFHSHSSCCCQQETSHL